MRYGYTTASRILRMVEDMLAARGIIVTHQTIRTWAEKRGGLGNSDSLIGGFSA